MIVNWKKANAGLKIVPLLNKEGKIEKNIVFIPGYNDITSADWEKASKHDDIKAAIERGDFVEVRAEKVVKSKEGKDEKKKDAEVTLAELEAEKALQVVSDTYDLETLEKWRKLEGRDEIRAAIANQIERINKTGKQGNN